MAKQPHAANQPSPANPPAIRLCLVFMAAIFISQGIIAVAQAPADPNFGMGRIETNKTLGGTTLQNARFLAFFARVTDHTFQQWRKCDIAADLHCLLVARITRVIEPFVVNAGGAQAPT